MRKIATMYLLSFLKQLFDMAVTERSLGNCKDKLWTICFTRLASCSRQASATPTVCINRVTFGQCNCIPSRVPSLRVRLHPRDDGGQRFAAIQRWCCKKDGDCYNDDVGMATTSLTFVWWTCCRSRCRCRTRPNARFTPVLRYFITSICTLPLLEPQSFHSALCLARSKLRPRSARLV